MISVFLPCRLGSERIPNKNTKEFSGVKGGLLFIKLKQLLELNNVEKIILSSNDNKVFEIAEDLSSERIILDKRPDELASSSTSTDDLIKYVPGIIKSDHILWTHVTSPFIDSTIYTEAINKYLIEIKKGIYDSLMSVNKVRTFIWNDKEPINYDRKKEKWPRTQTLPTLYEINSGFFISSRYNYVAYSDRIGKNPFLFEINDRESFDIDWPEDFELAEVIYNKIKR